MNRAVDLRQIRYFVAVAEERSFRRAAERLHLTQPPLSRQVSELEQALGTPLLVRTTRSVRLTPAGEIALREFRDLLATFDAAISRVAATRTNLPHLRIGMLYWYNMKGFGAFEQELRDEAAVAGLDVRTAISHEAIVALRRGDLDVALVAAPIETFGLESVVVGRVRHAAFVPETSPLARRRLLSLRDLDAAPPFFRFPRRANPLLYDHFARQYRALGFAPAKEAVAQDAMGVLAQIGVGRGCTIMPEPMMGQRHPGMVARRLRESVTIDLALVFGAAVDRDLRSALVRAARHLVPGTEGRHRGAGRGAPRVT